MTKTPYIYTKSIERGPANSVPLFMLHGHGGDHSGLEGLANKTGRNVYLVDLPGFGKSSDIEEFTIERCSTLLRRHIYALCEGRQYDLLGHSIGAAIALGVTVGDSNTRSLIMVNPIPKLTVVMNMIVRGTEELALHLPEATASKAIHSDFYNLATFLLHSRKKYEAGRLKGYINSQKQVHYSLRAWHEAGRAIYGMNQAEYAERVKAPTLTISGGHDKMSTIQAAKNLDAIFSKSQFKIIKNAGHFIPSENTLDAGNVINEFLLELDKSK